MKTRTAAAILACTLAACSDDAANPVAPSAPAAAPSTAAAETASGLPAAAPAVAVLQPLEPPSIDVDPPMRFDLPRLPSSWFERPSFSASGHRRYTGLRIVTDAEYPGRIDQHRSQKLRAVITRRDGVSATSGADWRTGNAHVATVDQHGRVTARNPGRFDTIATARGLEARMTGMEVYPGPGREFNDRFWSEMAYDTFDGDLYPYLYPLEDPLPGFYFWLSEPGGFRVVDPGWATWARRHFPRIVESLTGKPFRGRIEEGYEDRQQVGWITIVFDRPPHEVPREDACGRARVGANRPDYTGRIWIYLNRLGDSCYTGYDPDGRYLASTLFHEIGHALGFFHVRDADAIMCASLDCRGAPISFSAREQYHGRLAYRIGRGFREYCGWPLRVACGELPRRGAAPRMLTLP